MGFDGGWLRTASPTSAEHAQAGREVGRLVLQAPSSVATRRFPKIRLENTIATRWHSLATGFHTRPQLLPRQQREGFSPPGSRPCLGDACCRGTKKHLLPEEHSNRVPSMTICWRAALRGAENQVHETPVWIAGGEGITGADRLHGAVGDDLQRDGAPAS